MCVQCTMFEKNTLRSLNVDRRHSPLLIQLDHFFPTRSNSGQTHNLTCFLERDIFSFFSGRFLVRFFLSSISSSIRPYESQFFDIVYSWSYLNILKEIAFFFAHTHPLRIDRILSQASFFLAVLSSTCEFRTHSNTSRRKSRLF